MSKNGAASSKTKQAGTWLVAIGGVLGLFKAFVEYAHTFVENSSLILTILYYLGTFMIGWIFELVVLGVLLSWIPWALSKISNLKENTRDNAYLVAVAFVGAMFVISEMVQF